MRAACLAMSFCAAVAWGQAAPAPAAPLTLDSLLTLALERNPAIEAGRYQVDVDLGAVEAAHGPFDVLLQTSFQNSVVRTPTILPGAPGSLATVVNLSQNTGSYVLGGAKQFMSGITVTPQVTLTQVAESGEPGVPVTAEAVANLGLDVPLWRDLGGRVTSAPVRQAELLADAGRLDLRQTASVTVANVVSAYWNYVSAKLQRAVLAAAESRADRLVVETAALIKADERPPSDIKQVQANAATQREARISAEQAELAAWQQVALLVGLPARSVAMLPDIGTPLPAERSGEDYDHAAIDALCDTALARRPDLASLRRNEAATRVAVAAAQNSVKPRLDLIGSVGYAGFQQGPGIGRFFSPLYRAIPGINATVGLSYQLPIGSAAAHGLASQNLAVAAQQTVSDSDLARQIVTNVIVASEALRRGRLALREADTAASLSAITLDNERRKYQLGTSTVFDLLIAEDNLTNADLGKIQSQAAYAVALVTLRHQTGTLIETVRGRLTVHFDHVTTPP